ncbi:hypothetical protein [Microbacterium sp. SS28]|uniref:hypothetical protein n=1 Tax=Microbacterium sp. SS28 TaxID=2919948 RepID=UPI001FAB20BE|nr:hypothetical protein [Microbacterium sp. SS28]
MSLFSRFRRKKTPYAAVSDEERIARYLYLLGTLPASVIESAHASAFKDLPPERRREMVERLRPFMSEAEQAAASDDPTVLAKLVRRAEERRAARENAQTDAAAPRATTTLESDPRDAVDPRNILRDTGVMTIVATHFMMSASINSYFLVGAGSLTLDGEPGWVGDMVDPGPTGGSDFGGFEGGGGFDGGAGGFDAGGFGGGFDGGGGFG